MILPFKSSLFILLLLFVTTSYSYGKTTEEHNKTFENLTTERIESKMIIGGAEKVRLSPPNIILKARIDTGAKVSSVDAREITPFERNGKKWVRFTCMEGEKKHIIERKVVDTMLVKRHGQESQQRYMVRMRLTLGNVSQLVNVTLNDREEFIYPLFIAIYYIFLFIYPVIISVYFFFSILL